MQKLKNEQGKFCFWFYCQIKWVNPFSDTQKATKKALTKVIGKPFDKIVHGMLFIEKSPKEFLHEEFWLKKTDYYRITQKRFIYTKTFQYYLKKKQWKLNYAGPYRRTTPGQAFRWKEFCEFIDSGNDKEDEDDNMESGSDMECSDSDSVCDMNE